MADYIIKKMSPDELVHFGVKGQKWGVRRYQNEDGTLTEAGKERYGNPVDVKRLDKALKKGIRSSELTKAHTIPKGTVIYRTTSTRDDSDSGTTYVSYLDMDRQHYKGGWIRKTGKTGEAYEHQYKLNEDINVPSREESRKAIQEVMAENKNLTNETVKAWLDVAVPEGSWSRVELMWNDAKNEKEAAKAWKDYTKECIEAYKNMTPDEAIFYTAQTLGLNKKVREKVIEKLSAKGYNAMTDEASVGGQNGWMKEGGDPLIIFDRSNMFTEVSNKQISRKEEAKADMAYTKQQRKANANRYGSW